MAQTVELKKKKKPQDHQPKAEKVKAPKPATPGIIDIDDEDELIPVRLVGVEYHAHRPKALLAVRLGERLQDMGDLEEVDEVVGVLEEFLRLMFGGDTTAEIIARLGDADDRLDVRHLFDLVEKMTEVAANRPPTSPADSAS